MLYIPFTHLSRPTQVKKPVAKAGHEIVEAATRMIKCDDNRAGGSTSAVVDMLMGEVKNPDGTFSYTSTIPRIMERGGFHMKIVIGIANVAQKY